jgi:hypothetical protein
MRTTRVLAALLAVLAAGCNRTYDVIEEVPAPDGSHRAVVFTTGGVGGIGSELHTSVSVLRSDRSRLDWPPNAFTVTHGPEPTPEGPLFGPRVSVRWMTPDTVEITYDPRASPLRTRTEAGGVHVRYRTALQDSAAAAGP